MVDVDPSGERASSILVTVRVRPFTKAERLALEPDSEDQPFLPSGSLHAQKRASSLYRTNQVHNILRIVDEKMIIFDPPKTSHNLGRMGERRFIFDGVFDMDASQEDVYNSTARPLLSSVLDGYNTTIFAYGATGCGKTHTILGTPQNPGVIYLLLAELYRRLDAAKDTKTAEITVLFLEIYNETIKDLLNPSTSPKLLVIRESAKKHTLVANLLIHSPALVEEVMDLIVLGNRNRTTSPTEANSASSRSHAVFQVNILQRSRSGDIEENHLLSTLSIIDLAGLERAAATRNRGVLLHEGANINRLLLSLGNCINALCDPRRRNHIPYRDLKLTRLLKFSLGGNCKTVMIVCVSPLLKHHDETLNTLKYADRAKKIRTKIVRNQQSVSRHVKAYLKLITEQKQEIDELRLRELQVLALALLRRALVQRETLTEIENLQARIQEHVKEKWMRFFILAKRKIVLSQRVQVLRLMETCDYPTYALCSQVVGKFEKQVLEMEAEYMSPTIFDRILAESSNKIKQNLCEHIGWDASLELIFDQAVELQSIGLKRECLSVSSVLYEHLLVLLSSQFNLVGRDTQDEIQQVLQGFMSDDFDAAVEKCSIEYMERNLQRDRGVKNIENQGDEIFQGSDTISADNSVIYNPKPRKRQIMRDFTKLTSTPESSPKRRLTLRHQWVDAPSREDGRTIKDTSIDSISDMQNEEGSASRQGYMLGDMDSSLVSPPLPPPPPPHLHSDLSDSFRTNIVLGASDDAITNVDPPLQNHQYLNKRLTKSLVATAAANAEGNRPIYNNENFEELSSSPPPTSSKLNMQACERVMLSSANGSVN